MAVAICRADRSSAQRIWSSYSSEYAQPYFLNAIEVYAAKYQVSDKCKYYLTENVDKVSQIEDVTDNIEKIYSKLARPLQVLENERYRYDGV